MGQHCIVCDEACRRPLWCFRRTDKPKLWRVDLANANVFSLLSNWNDNVSQMGQHCSKSQAHHHLAHTDACVVCLFNPPISSRETRSNALCHCILVYIDNVENVKLFLGRCDCDCLLKIFDKHEKHALKQLVNQNSCSLIPLVGNVVSVIWNSLFEMRSNQLVYHVT